MIQTPEQTIAELGASRIAKALEIKPATVRMWKVRKRIPRSAWPEISQAFPELTTEVLLKMERAA